MIVTARQLEDLHKLHGNNGHVTLPYRARLTPLAADYVRARKLVLGYSEVSAPTAPGASAAPQPLAVSRTNAGVAASAASSGAQGAFLWWCDGPCGPAKAAIIQEEKQSLLRALDAAAVRQNHGQDARVTGIVSAIKQLAGEVKSGRVVGGILLVQNAALAGVYANRCPSLRAVLGTCLEAVEQGVTQVAANVLIIEYPHKTLQQMRNMLSRFLRAPRTLSEDVNRQLQELASCA